MTPILFNLTLEKGVRSLQIRQLMKILANNTIPSYVDYMIIIGNTSDELVVGPTDFLNVIKSIGLEVNQNKTKYIMVTRGPRVNANLVVEDHTFQQIADFKYLRINISNHNNII